MIERVFTDEHKRKLIVRVNRSNIQIHTERKDLLDYQFDLNVELFKFLKEQSVKVWKTLSRPMSGTSARNRILSLRRN